MNMSRKNIIRELIILGLAGIALVFLWSNSVAIVLFLLAILILQLFFQKDPKNFWLVPLIFVLSFGYEALYVNSGVWTYPYGHLFNVPIWIVLGWVIFFLGLKEIFLNKHK